MKTKEELEEFIRKMRKTVDELEVLGVKAVGSTSDYTYGFAGGLKYAIGILEVKLDDLE